MQNRKRDTDVQNRLLDSVGEGKGGMFREKSMYIIYSETDHQPRLDAWDRCSGLVHWEDPEESGGEGGGRGESGWGIHVTPWLIHVSVWQNPLQCCEVISLQLIKINEKKRCSVLNTYPIFFLHVEQMKTSHFNVNSNGTKSFELHSIRQLQVYSEPFLSKLVVRLWLRFILWKILL